MFPIAFEPSPIPAPRPAIVSIDIAQLVPVASPKPDFDRDVLEPLRAAQKAKAIKAAADAAAALAAQEAAQAAAAALAAQQAADAAAAAQTASRVVTASTDEGSAKLFIYMHESGNNPNSVNPNSGACGLGQALPCSKMGCALGDYGCQDAFFTEYMAERYGSWQNARAFWLLHSWW